jgi:hypothetical protein
MAGVGGDDRQICPKPPQYVAALVVTQPKSYRR